MTSGKKTVDDYIRSLDGWQVEVVSELRGVVQDAAPEAHEAIKWAQPVYEINGPFCYIKAFKEHVNFGFWRGVDVDDPAGLLQGTGEKMRHVRITDAGDIQKDVFQEYVRSAIKLNLAKGDPTKNP